MTYHMEVREISSDIIHVMMDTRRTLCSTFMRFQEYYECPDKSIRGQVFSRAKFLRWYEGNYFKDWMGFNLPDLALEPFHAGKFDPLIKCEKKLLGLLKKYRGTKYCVIGTVGMDAESLVHEISHAFWYLSSGYKKKMLKIIAEMDAVEKKKIEELLMSEGYDESVLLDELCAYIVDGGLYLEKHGIDMKKLDNTMMDMEIVFGEITNRRL